MVRFGHIYFNLKLHKLEFLNRNIINYYVAEKYKAIYNLFQIQHIAQTKMGADF